MFVWVVHRITGLLLILLLGLKFFTSFFLMTKGARPDWAVALHTNALSDVLLILCGVYHALYGLRTMAVDLGVRRDRLLFWSSTISAGVVSIVLLVIYFTRGH